MESATAASSRTDHVWLESHRWISNDTAKKDKKTSTITVTPLINRKGLQDPRGDSRGHSIGHLGNGLAGLDMTVVQAEGEEFLKAGIDLLVHRGVLRGNLAELLEQPRATLVVVPLGVLQALAMLRAGLGGLDGTGLGMDRAGALHGRGRGGARDSSLLAVDRLLLLGRGGAGWRRLGRAVALRGRVVVHPPHVVEQVPSTRESISGHGSLASFPQAEVRVVSVAMESVGLALVTEEAGIGGKPQLGIHAGGNLAPVGLQVGVQVFTMVLVSSCTDTPQMVCRGTCW